MEVFNNISILHNWNSKWSSMRKTKPLCVSINREWMNFFFFLGWVMDLIPSAYYNPTKRVYKLAKLIWISLFRQCDLKNKFKLDACINEQSFVRDSILSKTILFFFHMRSFNTKIQSMGRWIMTILENDFARLPSTSQYTSHKRKVIQSCRRFFFFFASIPLLPLYRRE